MQIQRMALFSAIIAMTAVTGILAGSSMSISDQTITDTTSIQMLGHLELVATDSEGNIKSYLQTDNTIVDQGVACISQQLFRDTGDGGGSSVCAGDPGPFDVISIGESTTGGTAVSALADVADEAGLQTPLQDIDVTVSDGTGTSTGQISVQFTHTGASTESITEALLTNSTLTADDVALAYKTFTAIPLDVNDQLTVTWTVTTTAS